MEKAIESYAFVRKNKDGRRSTCKECNNKFYRDKRIKLGLKTIDINPTHKICRCCKIDKPINEIAWTSKIKNLRNNICKKCKNKLQQDKRNKNPIKERLRKIKEYKITEDQYKEMFLSQDNKCAICNNSEKSLTNKGDRFKNLAIDHCHSTNKVRGLLCINCNQALGKVKDNIEILKSMIAYLEKHK